MKKSAGFWVGSVGLPVVLLLIVGVVALVAFSGGKPVTASVDEIASKPDHYIGKQVKMTGEPMNGKGWFASLQGGPKIITQTDTPLEQGKTYTIQGRLTKGPMGALELKGKIVR